MRNGKELEGTGGKEGSMVARRVCRDVGECGGMSCRQ